MSIVQMIAALAAIFFFVQILVYTIKNKLQDQQAFFWMMIASVGLLIALCLPLLNKLAYFVGIAYMPSLIYMGAFLIILSILVYQTTLLSQYHEKIKRLVQEVAFLKKDIEMHSNHKENIK